MSLNIKMSLTNIISSNRRIPQNIDREGRGTGGQFPHFELG